MSKLKKKTTRPKRFFFYYYCVYQVRIFTIFTRSKSPHALKTRIPGKSYIILVDRRDSVINHSSDSHETHIENV